MINDQSFRLLGVNLSTIGSLFITSTLKLQIFANKYITFVITKVVLVVSTKLPNREHQP